MGQLNESERGSATTRLGWVAVFLAGVLLTGSVTSSADGASAGEGFQIRGELLKPGENVSAGGSFGLAGKSVLPSNGLEDREFTITPAGPKRAEGTNGCPCQGLFGDGFESGDIGAWSAVSGS